MIHGLSENWLFEKMKIDSVVQVILLGLIIINFSYINCCTRQRKRSCLQENIGKNEKEKRDLRLLVPYDDADTDGNEKTGENNSSETLNKKLREVKRNPRDTGSSAIDEQIEDKALDNIKTDLVTSQETQKNKRSSNGRDTIIVGRKMNKLRQARNRKYMCLCKETDCKNRQCLQEQIRKEYPNDNKDFKEYNDDEYDENTSAEVTDDTKVGAFNPNRRYAQNVQPIAAVSYTEPTKFNIPFANNINFDQRIILNSKNPGRKNSKSAPLSLYQNEQLKLQQNQMLPIYHYRPYAMGYPQFAYPLRPQNFPSAIAPKSNKLTSTETNECIKLFGRPDCVLPSTPLSPIEDFKTIDLSDEISIKIPKNHELSAFLQLPKDLKGMQTSKIESGNNLSMEKNQSTTVYIPVYSTTDSQENADYNISVINQKPIYNPKTGYQVTSKYTMETVRGITPSVSNDEKNNDYVPHYFSKEIINKADEAGNVRNPGRINIVTQDGSNNQNVNVDHLEYVTEKSNYEPIPTQNAHQNLPDGRLAQGNLQNMNYPPQHVNVENLGSTTDRTSRTTTFYHNYDAIRKGSQLPGRIDQQKNQYEQQNDNNYERSNGNSRESPVPQSNSRENDLSIKIDKQVDEYGNIFSTTDPVHLLPSTKIPESNSPRKTLFIQPPESYNIEVLKTNNPPTSYVNTQEGQNKPEIYGTIGNGNLPLNETKLINTLEDVDNGNHHNPRKTSTLRNVDQQYKDTETLFRGLQQILLNNQNIGDEPGGGNIYKNNGPAMDHSNMKPIANNVPNDNQFPYQNPTSVNRNEYNNLGQNNNNPYSASLANNNYGVNPNQNPLMGNNNQGNIYNLAPQNNQYTTTIPNNYNDYFVPHINNPGNTQQNNNPYPINNAQTAIYNNLGQHIQKDLVLQNAIKKVLNNFVPGKSQDLLANYGNENAQEIVGATMDTLVPEIMNAPVLRNLFSVPEVENMITDAASNLLTHITGLPIIGDIPNMIKNSLHNVVNQIPISQTTVTPMAIDQYNNGQWVTERVSLLEVSSPVSVTKRPPKEVFDKIQSIINKSALGEQAVAHPLVQNLIVKAVKHSLDQERGVIDESTIRRAMDLIVHPQSTIPPNWPTQDPKVNKPQQPADNTNSYTNVNNPAAENNNFNYNWPATTRMPNAGEPLIVQPKSTINNYNKPLIVQPKETMNNNDYNWPDQTETSTIRDGMQTQAGYKPAPLIPVTEHQLKGGLWRESSKDLVSPQQTGNSDIDENRRKQLLQKLNQQQATTVRTKNHSPGTNIYYDSRNAAGNANPYATEKSKNERGDNLGSKILKIADTIKNEAIKYFSPNDRILEYLKNHPSTNNPPLTTTPQYFTPTYDHNTEMTQRYDNNFHYPTTGYQYTNYDTTTIGYQNNNDYSGSPGHRNDNDYNAAAPDYQNRYNVATAIYPNKKNNNNNYQNAGPLKYQNDYNENTAPQEYQNNNYQSTRTPGYQNNGGFPETVYYEGKDRPEIPPAGYDRSNIDNGQLKLLVEPTTDPLKFGYQTPTTEESVELKTASTRQINDESSQSYDPTFLGKLIPVDYAKASRARSVEDLQDSKLVYVGDGVRLPLTIRKLNDGSFALTLSDEVCKQFAYKKCPCCLPNNDNGVIMRERRSESEESELDLRGVGDGTSQEYVDFNGNRNRRESTEIIEMNNSNQQNKGMMNRMKDFLTKFINSNQLTSKSNNNHNRIDDMYYDEEMSEEFRGPPYKYQRWANEDRNIRSKTNTMKNVLSWMKDVAINSNRDRIRKRKSVDNI